MQTPSISKEFWIFSGLIVVLFLVGLYVQLFVFRNQETVLVQDGKTGEISQDMTQFAQFKDIPESGLLRVDWIGYAEPVPTSSEYYQWITDAKQKLYTAQPIVKSKVDSRNAGILEYSSELASVKLFSLGTITAPPQLKGKTLYLMDIPAFMPGGMIRLVVPNPETKTFTFVNVTQAQDVMADSLIGLGVAENYLPDPCLYSTDLSEGGYLTETDEVLCTDLFLDTVNFALVLDDIPVEVPHPNGSGTLRLIGTQMRGGYSLPYNIGGYGTGMTPEDLFNIRDARFAFSYQGVDVYVYNGTFVAQRTDGAVLLYRFDPYFLSPNGGEDKLAYPVSLTPDVSWLQKNISLDSYQPGSTYYFSGCSSVVKPTEDVIQMGNPDYAWFSEQLLVPVATTSRGEFLYAFADPKNQTKIQELFLGTIGYFESSLVERAKKIATLTAEEKQLFDVFVQTPPLLFWKDPDNNWRGYINDAIQFPVECGKPVIYLYPEETTDVNVQVAPNGGFTTTIPEYPVGGWNVQAKPDGTITSYDDGQVYPYLFWEGHAEGFGYPEEGFVFAQSEVEAGMTDVLTRFGMNEQETADFLEFWLPKMVETPYVFVTFADQRAFELAAPLKITPKPDSVLRVFMYFEGLDAPRVVEPLSIRPFVRKGFSVVEWGGVLVK
jgi:hypothetical protein